MSEEFKYLLKEDGTRLDVNRVMSAYSPPDRHNFKPAPPYHSPHEGPLEGVDPPGIQERLQMRAGEILNAADEKLRLRVGMHIHIEDWSKMSDDEKRALVLP